MNRSNIQDYKDSASETADTFAANARRAAYEVADKTRGVANKVSDWTETRAQDAAEALEQGTARTREFIQHRPVVTLALVVGISALTAYWLTRRPSTSNYESHY